MTVWIGANTIISNVDKILPLGSFISAVGFIALFITGIISQRAMFKKKLKTI
jgi:hypothetical protein